MDRKSKINIKTRYKKLLADTITPVSIYLQIRDRYSNPILLESSDYHGNENSYSYICFNPLASISFDGEVIKEMLPSGKSKSYAVENLKLINVLRDFSSRFEDENLDFKFISNG